ncbi:MAG: hypothetical protein ACLP7Q_27705 [Isosphaeraceae bacterium]
MARRTLNRRELRAAAEAAEAMGLPLVSESPAGRAARGRDEPRPLRSKPVSSARMRMVWAVCDMGGRTLATFDYADKTAAEAHIKDLKQQGKGAHFLRAVKEPMEGTSQLRRS